MDGQKEELRAKTHWGAMHESESLWVRVQSQARSKACNQVLDQYVRQVQRQVWDKVEGKSPQSRLPLVVQIRSVQVRNQVLETVREQKRSGGEHA